MLGFVLPGGRWRDPGRLGRPRLRELAAGFRLLPFLLGLGAVLGILGRRSSRGGPAVGPDLRLPLRLIRSGGLSWRCGLGPSLGPGIGLAGRRLRTGRRGRLGLGLLPLGPALRPLLRLWLGLGLTLGLRLGSLLRGCLALRPGLLLLRRPPVLLFTLIMLCIGRRHGFEQQG